MTRRELATLSAEVRQANAVLDALRPIQRALADQLERIDVRISTAEAVRKQCMGFASEKDS